MSSEVDTDSIKGFKKKLGTAIILWSDSFISMNSGLLELTSLKISAVICFLWLCLFSSDFLVSDILNKLSHASFVHVEKKCLHAKIMYLFV